MAIPTIPSVPDVGGFVQAGPQGISAGFNISLDLCNARPIMIYVTRQKGAPQASTAPWPPVEAPPTGAPAPPPPPPAPINRPPTPGAQKGGQIWRLFDTLAAIEKVPVWKDWAEEKKYPNGHWKPIYRQPPPPEKPPEKPPVPPVIVCTEVVTLGDTEERSHFKFDQPKCTQAASQFPSAFNDMSEVNGAIDQAATALPADAQVEGGGTVPLSQTPFERKVVVFGHADMCAPFHYNFGLSHRRNIALGTVMTTHPRGNELRAALLNTGRSAGLVPCSDFNPTVGPNAHEQAAENSPSGTANRPASQSFDGNPPNRRIELFVIPDYKSGSGKPSKIREILSQIRSTLMTSSGISAADWPDGDFPCPAGTTRCTTAGDDALLRPCHALSNQPGPKHQGGGQGPGFRQCKFYQMFTEAVRTIRLTDEQCHVEPQPQPQPQPTPQPSGPIFDHWEWIEDAPITEKQGEYHPPRGEHYSYYMDEMVKEGVDAHELFPPKVAVAPNNRTILDDFNLIKAGSIKVVKMDIGFWGDERAVEPSRRGGLRRVPKRYFGLVEGQFVFNCYFETPESRGFVRPCSEGFDKDLTPLCFALDQAVRAQGFKILIMAKAIAEDGPDKSRLKIFFPDMHMPRKFDEKDPVYATDDCIKKAQSVKSMCLHQLKRDYRLPAAMTPWLTTLDRRMCRDFFENNAPRLKLPHWYTQGGPRLPMRTTDTSSPGAALATAADAVRTAFNAIMQVGFRLFSFTQDDYRRMVRIHPENFPEKGYGRTRDILFNWFYGFGTDRNTPPPPEGVLERTGKNLVPGIVQDVLDTRAGTKLGLDDGRPPARGTEALDQVRTNPNLDLVAQVDAGPARDLIRFLNVIRAEKAKGTATDVFHTGDLYELWANRRFLFEDFAETDDPGGQVPDILSGLDKPSGDGIGGMALDALKFLVGSFAKILLGGVNAQSHDLWWRRETNKAGDPQQDPDQYQLQPEEAYNIDKFDPQLHLPRFTPPPARPGAIGGGIQTPPGGGQISADGLNYTHFRLGTTRTPDDGSLGPFPASGDRGRGYLIREVQRRIQQVEAWEGPLRTDQAGAAEDRRLLGGNVASNGRGLWNKAVVDAFRSLGTTFIYGNHDDFRGVPRDNGVGTALPYYSEPGLWVEHGHRFEDSNVDGQPFGSFLTNLAYEIMELPFGEGLLDEYMMHREQNTYQPGIIQWFLLVQFGGQDFLKRFQRPRFPRGDATPLENVPGIFPFRISVNSHTHVPDLVVAQIIFKDRETATVDLPLLGTTNISSIFNAGLAVLKGALLWKKMEDWYNQWDNRNGFQKWWEDIKGNTINWGVDFGGLAACADKAADFLRKQGENKVKQLKKEFEDSGKGLKQTVDQNRRNLGL